MLKIWWIWKIEISSEELLDGCQTVLYKREALFWGSQMSGSVSNPFQSNIPFNITSNFTPIQVYFRFNYQKLTLLNLLYF